MLPKAIIVGNDNSINDMLNMFILDVIPLFILLYKKYKPDYDKSGPDEFIVGLDNKTIPSSESKKKKIFREFACCFIGLADILVNSGILFHWGNFLQKWYEQKVKWYQDNEQSLKSKGELIQSRNDDIKFVIDKWRSFYIFAEEMTIPRPGSNKSSVYNYTSTVDLSEVLLNENYDDESVGRLFLKRFICSGIHNPGIIYEFIEKKHIVNTRLTECKMGTQHTEISSTSLHDVRDWAMFLFCNAMSHHLKYATTLLEKDLDYMLPNMGMNLKLVLEIMKEFMGERMQDCEFMTISEKLEKRIREDTQFSVARAKQLEQNISIFANESKTKCSLNNLSPSKNTVPEKIEKKIIEDAQCSVPYAKQPEQNISIFADESKTKCSLNNLLPSKNTAKDKRFDYNKNTQNSLCFIVLLLLSTLITASILTALFKAGVIYKSTFVPLISVLIGASIIITLSVVTKIVYEKVANKTNSELSNIENVAEIIQQTK